MRRPHRSYRPTLVAVRFTVLTILLVTASGTALRCNTTVSAEELPSVVTTESPALIRSELIYPLGDRPTPQCHASTIVESTDGLVSAWFGGTREGDPDVGIWLSRHVDGSWQRPTKVADGSESIDPKDEGSVQEYPCWNPVLFQIDSQSLVLFYKAGPNPRQWWGMTRLSSDGGKTWSPHRRLGKSDSLPAANQNLIGPVKNKPIRLSGGAKNGQMLCPSSTENDGWRVHFESYQVLGSQEVQQQSDAIKPIHVVGPIDQVGSFNAIQPSILNHSDGRLQILCRTRENVVATSWSSDQGDTWTSLRATQLPNPNSGTDAVTLRDGRHLLVYNHATRTKQLSGREVLNVATSSDGENWTVVITLEHENQRAEFSYPAVIQTEDGRVHITYTWQRQSIKHVVLDPMKL